MGDFNRRGGRRDGRRGGGDRKEMHKAVCDNCGDNCEVPFRPTSGKPILCSNCFAENRENGARRIHDRDSGRRGGGDRKEMHKAVCDNCGDNCEVPFRPTAGKPVLCSNCFGEKGGRGGRQSSGPSGDQFDAMSKKLDQIIELLSSDKKPSKPKAPAKEKKAPAKKKPAAKKAPAKKPAAKKAPAKKKAAPKKKPAAKKKVPAKKKK